MVVVAMPVSRLHFSQPIISDVFSDGRHLLQLVQRWLDDPWFWSSADIMISVVRVGRYYYALDHRRLFCMKLLQFFMGVPLTVMVFVTVFVGISEVLPFTSACTTTYAYATTIYYSASQTSE